MSHVNNTPPPITNVSEARSQAQQLREQAWSAPTEERRRQKLHDAARLEDRIQAHVENERRADLLEDLLYRAYRGEQLPWSEQELKAMDNTELAEAHALVTNTKPKPEPDLSWVKPMREVLAQGPDDAA